LNFNFGIAVRFLEKNGLGSVKNKVIIDKIVFEISFIYDNVVD